MPAIHPPGHTEDLDPWEKAARGLPLSPDELALIRAGASGFGDADASDRDLRELGVLPRIAARLVVDTRHRYCGTWDREPSALCRVRIFDVPAIPPVIVCTELEENESTSITNVAEYLAAEVLATHLPHRLEADEPCIWVEHYPRPRGAGHFREGLPSFDHVTFATWRPVIVWRAGVRRIRLGKPHWRHMPPAEVAALLGDPTILEE